jgi:RNA polymerase I-specific transcription initiation factor RRN7
MKSKLPAGYHTALDTTLPLRPGDLQKSVIKLATMFNQDFGMELPPLNVPLLIFKYVKELGLPRKSPDIVSRFFLYFPLNPNIDLVEIYVAVQRLAKLLGITFTFPAAAMGRKRSLAHPETLLAGLVVVATKLSQPFDHVAQGSSDASDPTNLSVDWDIWKDIMTEEKVDGLKKGKEVHVTDQEVLNMSGKELDDYLDWYQKTWVDESEARSKFYFCI